MFGISCKGNISVCLREAITKLIKVYTPKYQRILILLLHKISTNYRVFELCSINSALKTNSHCSDTVPVLQNIHKLLPGRLLHFVTTFDCVTLIQVARHFYKAECN